MKKLLTFLMMSILAIGVGWAAEGDLHDMGKSQSTLLNNNAAIPSINIDEQSYPIKAVTINWKYNKPTEDVVTIEVKVGGTSWGTQSVGTNTTADAIFEGESTIGAVEIIFTNNAGNGTGKGTFYVNSVKLTEGASSGGLFSLTLPIGLTGGTVTASGADDLTSITAGTEMTVTANPSTDYVLDWMKANGTVVENPYTFNIYANTEITAAFKEKPTYLFYESFNSCNKDGGNDDIWSNISTSGTIATDNSGWDFLKGNAANACARFGTTSSLGSATSPTINVETGQTYSIAFKAGAWDGNSEKTNLLIYALNENGEEVNNIIYSDQACTTPLSSVSMTKGAWTTYTIYVKTTISKIKIVWEGQSANNSRFFLDEVLVEEAVAPEVATPVIAGETPFLTSTEVTITCATEDATIYYTTDDTDPTNESTEYVGPFEINESKTVKAIAYDANNNASTVASKEFVKTPTPSTVAEIVDLADGTTFVFNGNLVVSAQSEEYLYAQDATGGMLLYGSAPTFNKGDVIPTGFGAKKTTFKGAPELKEMTNMQNATETEQINALAITPNQVTVENAFKYAVIKGATISGNTIAVGEETVAIYNRFGVTVPTDGKTYDIYGVTGWFEGAQFMPLEFVAEAEPEYYLVGSFNQVFNEETNKYDWIQQDPNYKFTLNDDGKYVLNGVTFPDNVEFKILKVKGSQIIWCGGPADGEVYGIHGGWYKDIPLTMNGGKNYKIDAAGTFNFTMTIDDNNSSNNKFTVIKSPVVIKGSFNEWSAGVEMENNEGNTGWTKTLEFTDNTEFGFNDGWGNWHGGNGIDIASTDLGTNLTMGTDGNFKMLAAGKYEITVNRDLSTLVVTKVLTPHNIVVDSDIENGTIEIKDNKTTAVVGETVTIVVTPDEGYVLENVSVMAGETTVEVNDLQFVMPDADVFVSAIFKEAEPESMVYRLVTDATDFVAGKKYLIANLDGSALIGNLTGSSGKQYAEQVTDYFTHNESEKTITLEEGCETTVITLGGTTDAWTFNNGTGYLAYTGSSTNSNNYLWLVDDATANGATWKIDLSGGAKNVQNNFNTSRYLQYNSTSGNERFSGYTGTQKGIAFYKQVEAGEVFTPVISGETPFLESTTVTITCATEGAEIRYTLNGQDPTAESNLYTEPFTINEALTVKAIAFKNGNSSSIVSKEFKKIPRVATIAEYIDLNDNAEFVFTGDAVVTYQNGSNTWIKDETGYALIYASGQPEYNNGNVIPTGWGGKKTIYNGIPEITNVTGLENATETAEAAPVEKLVNEITASDVNAFYRISEITLSANTNNFNIVDGNNVLSGYNKFGITMPEDIEGKIFNVVGVVTLYNNGPEFYIISYEEVIEPVTLDGVAFTADRQWATWYGDANLALPEGVTAYVVTGVQGEAVAVEALDYIPANTGVLLNRETAAESVSAMPYTGEAGTIPTNLLVGSLEAQTISNAYLLYNNQFILAQDGTTVGAHRCYLPMSTSTQGAPVLRIGAPGTVTGVETINTNGSGDNTYYNLMGQPVTNPAPGIYIRGGKKVIVK